MIPSIRFPTEICTGEGGQLTRGRFCGPTRGPPFGQAAAAAAAGRASDAAVVGVAHGAAAAVGDLLLTGIVLRAAGFSRN